MATLPNVANICVKSVMMRKKKDNNKESSLEKLENLLKPVQNFDTDSDFDSEVSEISDVFEEFHKNSYLKPQAKRYLTKHEADVKTMEEFTQVFKDTMANLRKDLQIGDELLLEKTHDIESVFEQPQNPNIFPKISVNKELEDLIKNSTDSIPKPKKLVQMRKVSDISSSSVIWHMLTVNSDFNKFQISPPGFDAFNQEQPHWLQRASVSWSDIDQATLKCEKWLEQHCVKSK